MQYFKIVDKKGIKTSTILKKLESKFKVYSYLSPKELDTQFPAPKNTTTRYFEKNIEADEKYRNMSADDLEQKDIQGITLRERLIMELEYFNETGNHLDLISWTLCSGSRGSDGGVPGVYWVPDAQTLDIDWLSTVSSDDSLRARAAVNPSTSNLESSEPFQTFCTTCPHCLKPLQVTIK